MVELKSERLLLRPWKESNAEELSRIANNKNIAQNMNDKFPFPYNLNDAKDFIHKSLSKEIQCNFAIEFEGKLAGGIGFELRDGKGKGVAGGGYWLGEEFWGKGIATETWMMIINHVFENFDVRKICASVYSWNPASAKVQEKCGLIKEGVLRNEVLRFEKIGNEFKYGILREEWEKKFVVEWEGNFYDCEWFDDTIFENIKGEIRGVHGFIFDDNKNICLVKFPGKDHWQVPGGHPESYDKSFDETLVREVDEEVDLELKEIKRVGYIKAVPRGDFDTVNYALRYVAEVEKIKEQTIDPAEGIIPEREFVKPEEFENFTGWIRNGNFQIKKALERLNLN
ncbi:MAG: GNAT family N-acetyltransferase [Nanoarchaeota archaeon]|nr:GNAT family N-acetyltransferase [Nanoarchaeota archaeon]